MEKIINTKLILRHKLEAEWLESDYIPEVNEPIVYDIEVNENGEKLQLPDGRSTPYTYQRFKMGDGIHLAKDLPFLLDESKLNIISQLARVINFTDYIAHPDLCPPLTPEILNDDDAFDAWLTSVNELDCFIDGGIAGIVESLIQTQKGEAFSNDYYRPVFKITSTDATIYKLLPVLSIEDDDDDYEFTNKVYLDYSETHKLYIESGGFYEYFEGEKNKITAGLFCYLIGKTASDKKQANLLQPQLSRISKDYTDRKIAKAIRDLDIPKDWNQNDETAPDYIKNRTHYEYTEFTQVFIDDRAYIVPEYEGIFNEHCPDIAPLVDFENNGKVFRIYCPNAFEGYKEGTLHLYDAYDSQKHNCTGHYDGYIGNPILAGGIRTPDGSIINEDTGEDFCFTVYHGCLDYTGFESGLYGLFLANFDYSALDVNANITIKAECETALTIKQLDEIYIPDTIARTAEVNNTISSASEQISGIIYGMQEQFTDAIVDLQNKSENLLTTKVDKRDMIDLSKRTEILEEASENSLYTLETRTDGVVPKNALKHAQIEYISGKSFSRLRNLLPFYPSYIDTNRKTKWNGVERIVNDDGTIIFNGTATGDIQTYYFAIADKFKPAEGGDFFLSGCPEGGSESGYCLNINVHNKNGYNYMKLVDTGAGAYANIPSEDFSYMTLYITVKAGTVCDNLVFKPQLEHNIIKTPFESYGLKGAKVAGIKVAPRNHLSEMLVDDTEILTTIDNTVYIKDSNYLNRDIIDNFLTLGESYTIFAYLNEIQHDFVPELAFYSYTFDTSSETDSFIDEYRINMPLIKNQWIRIFSETGRLTTLGLNYPSDASNLDKSCSIRMAICKGDISLDEFLNGYSTVYFPSELVDLSFYGIGDGTYNKFYGDGYRADILYARKDIDSIIADNEIIYQEDVFDRVLERDEVETLYMPEGIPNFNSFIEVPSEGDYEIQLIPYYEGTPKEYMQCAITYRVSKGATEIDLSKDWNQSDETAPDYIKNRTHYIAEGYSGSFSEITFEEIIDYENTYEHLYYEYVFRENIFEKIKSCSKQVNISILGTCGEEFEGVLEYDTESNTFIDNLAHLRISEAEINEDGTIILDSSNRLRLIGFGVLSGAWDNIVIKLELHAPSVVKQLDEQFIPDTIARTEVVNNTISNASEQITGLISDIQGLINTYILNIDYSTLAFDTTEIVIGNTTTSTSVLGQAILGQLILA